jgi:hypothetical protein
MEPALGSPTLPLVEGTRPDDKETKMNEANEDTPTPKSRELTCPECQGHRWSRSASGLCTWCRGSGVIHTDPTNRFPAFPDLTHAGPWSRCEFADCRALAPRVAS